MSTAIKYGLRHRGSGEILRVEERSNDEGSFCVQVSHELRLGARRDWLVDSPEKAEYVRLNPTPWYNAGFDTPEHEFGAAELEVVRVTVTVECQPVAVELPTPEELLEWRYGPKGRKPDAKRLKEFLRHLSRGSLDPPLWSDYEEWLEERREPGTA